MTIYLILSLFSTWLTSTPPNDLLKPRGGCGVEPSIANLFVRVSPPPAGGEAASPATDVGRLF